ncbi:universal stress protein [Halovivax sp.]|uniref:universal stress protein n=1 Tax=Halovivax sp. TaxID=1935978 RepID=UPI0025C594BA|nr:universal stress protein [Halovivax sp.]
MTVLVAFDGSEPSQKALRHAVREFPDEEFVLLRVIEAADGATEAGFELAREKLKELRDEARTELSTDVDDVLDPADLDLRVETAVGMPAREIVRFADEHDVDHVVVGNHGREGVARVLLGSVAETVVRRAAVPVTVVR